MILTDKSHALMERSDFDALPHRDSFCFLTGVTEEPGYRYKVLVDDGGFEELWFMGEVVLSRDRIREVDWRTIIVLE